jgi:hypothetical protein
MEVPKDRQVANPTPSQQAGWVEVTSAPGGPGAAMVVEYLQSQGIEAWSWQEGAGDALGLTVGPLGTAHILVPAADADLAHSLLETPAATDEEFVSEDNEPQEESPSGLGRAVLGALAIVINPLVSGLALLLSPLLGSREEIDELFLIRCPGCSAALELSEAEIRRGQFVCPECGQTHPVD